MKEEIEAGRWKGNKTKLKEKSERVACLYKLNSRHRVQFGLRFERMKASRQTRKD